MGDMEVDENLDNSVNGLDVKLRQLSCALNYLPVSDGSALFIQGNTVVVAGVYGPVESRLQDMIYDKANVKVVYSPLTGPTNIDDRFIELYVGGTYKQAILTTLHPSTCFSINLQEMQSSAGLLACAINATCLALLHASVPMKYTVAAVHAMIDRDTDELIVDPNEEQVKNARATFTFGYDSVKKNLVCVHTTGGSREEEFMSALEECRKASLSIFDFYRSTFKKFSATFD